MVFFVHVTPQRNGLYEPFQPEISAIPAIGHFSLHKLRSSRDDFVAVSSSATKFIPRICKIYINKMYIFIMYNTKQLFCPNGS